MDLHIDDLKISDCTKNILHELGFTMVSDLEGHDYISFFLSFFDTKVPLATSSCLFHYSGT